MDRQPRRADSFSSNINDERSPPVNAHVNAGAW
jgi:hypothetical protein